MKKLLLLLLFPFIFFLSLAHAETTIPDRPSNGIYDPQHYLSEKVSDELSNFNSNSETQIGIYIVDTLDGKNIEEQANEIARAWKIGYADANKGALIAVAINDRKFRIETSNELSTILTDSKANEILNSSKSYMKNQDYDGAIIHMIDEVSKVVNVSSKEFEENYKKQNRIDIFQHRAFIVASFFVIVVIFFVIFFVFIVKYFANNPDDLVEIINKGKRKDRSSFDYQGDDKLTPKDLDFKDNETWTPERVKEFWSNEYLARSQYYYKGLDKLYPDMPLFVMNDSWNQKRIDVYKKEQEEKKKREEKEREEYLKRLEKEREYDFKIRLGRSQFNYKGEDKLYPTNSKFVPNPTWTSNLVSKHLASQKEQYSAPRKRQQSKKSLKGSRGNSDNSNSSSYLYSSSSSSGSSSSSWSSGGWGGGGFDGGGSSGSW